VAFVVRGVVNQYVDGAGVITYFADYGLQTLDIAQVAVLEHRCDVAALADCLDQCLRWLPGDVDKIHLRALGAEVADDGGADTGTAAADEDDVVFKTGILGKF